MKSTYTDHAANEKWLNELNQDRTVLAHKAFSAKDGTIYSGIYERDIIGGMVFDSLFESGKTYEEALSNARAKWNADYQ
jgi:hypothetical protein